MARVVSILELPMLEGSRPHTEVDCGFRLVRQGDEVLVQLETYGSTDRAIPGKVSQVIQFDR
jgi:hypothetical protein